MGLKSEINAQALRSIAKGYSSVTVLTWLEMIWLRKRPVKLSEEQITVMQRLIQEETPEDLIKELQKIGTEGLLDSRDCTGMWERINDKCAIENSAQLN